MRKEPGTDCNEEQDILALEPDDFPSWKELEANLVERLEELVDDVDSPR